MITSNNHHDFDLPGLHAEVLSRNPALADIDVSGELGAFINGLDEQDPYRGYSYISQSLVDRLDQLVRRLGPKAAPEFLNLLLLELIAQFDSRFEKSGLHDDFRPEFARNFDRILADIRTPPEAPMIGLGSDMFLKDLGIARLHLIPCVSHLVYRYSGVPRRALIGVKQPSAFLRVARTLARAGGFRPFLENHVHPRMLDRFDQAGRQQCYRLICRLLDLWPDARGLMGTSWYYDPNVGQISPRLAYLHDEPAQAGACFVDMGVHPDATASALARSPTRARLAQEGRYQPRNYMMLWTRADILARYGQGQRNK
ncbi:hypothetical protein ACNQFN_18145 [Thauera butanivorans]|uniref:hypothetical protein n=1 Tax=Thauera butanivorans TaxID=86174 RepID=UPI003AB6B115